MDEVVRERGATYHPQSVTDGNGRTWQATYDTLGNALTSTTPKGTVTTSTYSYSNFPLGELTSVKEGSKTATAYTYYEPSGLVHEVEAPVPGDAGTGLTQPTTYAYTAMGNLASVTSPGNNATGTRTVSYGYTADGSYSQSAALGEPITATDERGKVTHLRYDARGNLLTNSDSLGNATDWIYNFADQAVTELSPYTGTTGSGRASRTTAYLYIGGSAVQIDSRSESNTVVRTVNLTYGYEGETLSRSGSTEGNSMTYDAAYSLKSVIDGGGHGTIYIYDTNGQLIQTSGTSGALTITGYDAVGNMLSRTDGNGQITNCSYSDTDGLLTSVTYPGATASNVSYTYDTYDRANSVTDGTGTQTTAYDDEDAVTSTTTTYTGLPARTFSYAYWPDGSRQTMANPAGTWTYAYDAAGRYTSMTSPAGTNSATWLDNGWQASRTLPNGVSTQYAYNAVGALSGLSNQVGAATLSQYGGMAYDGVFNLTGLSASVPGALAQGGSTTYAYDAKDRLVAESSTRLGGYSQSHVYDAAGNPTTLRGASQTFDANNRQTGAVGQFAYDGNGSPTIYRGATMAYDPEARATTLGSLSAGYRADGRRAWKSYLGNKTYFLYDDDGNPAVEVDANGAVLSINVYAPDGLVARNQAGTWAQYAFDPEGNVALRLGVTGAVMTSSAYDAYGQEWIVGSYRDPYGFHARDGYYADRETGLYYCYHRYYDPQAGRWITTDPAGYGGGMNLYSYCGASPLGWADRSGLDPEIRCKEPKKSAIKKQLNDVCKNRIKLLKDPELRKSMAERCKDVVITCLPPGSPDCDPDPITGKPTFGSTPRSGRLGTGTVFIGICPDGFNAKEAGCLGKTILHEMVHSTGETGLKNNIGNPDEGGASLDQREVYCRQKEGEAYGPGKPPCP